MRLASRPNKNVFINCPFDEEYLPFLRALLFTVRCLGYRPRIASESLNSGLPRIAKILKLISTSRYSIHDLSRIQAKEPGEYSRLNMPLELGLFMGCAAYGAGSHRLKQCLIVVEKPFGYQAAISDMAGSDVQVHDGSPEGLIRAVRNWLRQQGRLSNAPGPQQIWIDFNLFMTGNQIELEKRGFSPRDIAELSIDELIHYIDHWLQARR